MTPLSAEVRGTLTDAAHAFFILLVACLFAYRTFGYATASPIESDAHQNLRAAYHLVHTGVMGADHLETDKPRPQMRREPVPILAITAFLALHPAFDKPYTIADVAEGPLTKTVKGVNAFWRFLAAVFFMLLCAELFVPRYTAAAWGLAGLALSETFFFLQPAYVDRLMTEIPGAAMLLASSWCAVRFAKKKNSPRAIALGLALGLLALTKAAFFYISIVFVSLLLLMDIIKNRRGGKIGFSNELTGPYLGVMLALSATIAPWMIRNYVEFGTAQITERASEIMGTRVLLVEQPLLGEIYFFTPAWLRKWSVGSLTGYTPTDLLPGGPIGKLPDIKEKHMGIFAQRMQAEKFTGDAEQWRRQMVIRYIAEHPIRYVASIPIFAYKGMGFMQEWSLLFNGLVLLCFFSVFLWALFAGEQILVAAFGLGAGLFAFTSVFTDALVRYNSPMVPLVVISVMWVAAVFFRRLISKNEVFPRYRAKIQSV
jgi:hypothetical protein